MTEQGSSGVKADHMPNDSAGGVVMLQKADAGQKWLL